MTERYRVLEKFEKDGGKWKETAHANIEKYRKGDATLRLCDKDGKPLSGYTVHIRQKNHAFSFGANLFMLEELETKEKNDAYKAIFKDTFNMATLPFYWMDVEPEKGKQRYDADSPKIYRRPAIDLCMNYCLENGIEPREHALAYEKMFPRWLHGKPTEEVKREYERRCREISERYADKIRTIEVTNEMYWEKGKTDFYHDPDYVTWCFKTARKYFPHNQLGINEWSPAIWEMDARNGTSYTDYIQKAIDNGAEIDAIGAQYHVFLPKDREYEKTRLMYDPENLLTCIDHFTDTFRKPLQVTEITVPAYSNDPEDEDIQAKLLENLYTVWFSHPHVEQIIYWNLVDGYCYVDNATPEAISASQGDMTQGENIYFGGLIRFDFSKKPAYYALRRLIKETWHTEETLVLDGEGCGAFRGFFGDYEVTLQKDGESVTKTVSLQKDKDAAFVLTV